MTTRQRPAVVGIFTDNTQAQQAMRDLMSAGFGSDQIRYSGPAENSKGGFWQGIKGFFTSEDTTNIGTITDDLSDLGLPENEIHFYESEYGNGRTVLAVSAPNREQEAFNILRSDGAYNYSMRMADATGSSTQTSEYTQQVGTTQADTDETRSMRLHKEQLQTNKEQVQTGEVRLRKEVVTEQKNINVPVTHEEVFIERHPVSDQPTEEPIGDGETYRIPVSEEQVNITRQTMSTGDVSISKRQVQETQQVNDTVRREKVHIDRDGDIAIHDTKTDPFHASQKNVEDLLEDE